MKNKLWEVDNLTILQKLNIVNKMLTEEYKKQLFSSDDTTYCEIFRFVVENENIAEDNPVCELTVHWQSNSTHDEFTDTIFICYDNLVEWNCAMIFTYIFGQLEM